MGRGRWLLLAATVAALVLAPSGASGDHVPAVSGKVVTTYRGWLQVSSLTGRDEWPLTPPHRYKRRRDYNPVWSPDGSQVAFARWTPKGVSVMVVNADGSGLHPVAVFEGHTQENGFWGRVDDIAWSPDDRSLAYVVYVRREPSGIYVSSAESTGKRLVAPLPANGFFSLFGWTRDSRRVTYAFAYGEPALIHYDGPAYLRTVVADGSDTKALVVEDAITDVAWEPDGTLVFVRCSMGVTCQLAVFDPATGKKQPLTHSKPLPPDLQGVSESITKDDALLLRPHSDDVVYMHARSIYEVSPATKRVRLIRTLPCPKRRCPSFDTGVYLAGITPDGRYALIEYFVAGVYPFDRDYRLDLATGAVTKTHLITADPAEIFLN
jgi:WD40 repeat protein